ncbi:hypothetical protein EUTSA_v10001655mg [Eutrema salsugineum]|uniref:Uncharacterized protein n=1 Tax=Eutrema salsugineum TaxID=72664 RepID=V4L6Z3_EUTSA|nr:uncharacterized protein LOC18015459 [Eutrema salsugineum]ESQ39454.1 hypothetical protein EUTSA_v10001655mg [Eutrema salsugineum]
MAKNSQSSSKNQEKKKKENRVCEKIFRAVTSPVRTVGRISTKPSVPNHNQAEAVRVKFSETLTQASKPITKIVPKKTMITRVETTMKTDERFNEYIKKAKLRIRAMTNLGDMMRNDASETSETETRDHHHRHHVPISRVSRESSSGRSDHFSEYIKKAKMKLLGSSSTIARANSAYDSFKVVKD